MRAGQAAVAVAVWAVAAAAGCSGDDAAQPTATTSSTAAPTTTTPPTTATAPNTTAAPGPTSTTPPTTGGELAVGGGGRCFNPVDGYAVERPPGWRTNDGGVLPRCSLFDPEPIVVPEASEVPFDIGVSMRVADVDLATVEGGLTDEVGDRREEAVGGCGAVRIESTSTGDGLGPAGIATVRWLVDLGGRTLVASAFDVGSPAFSTKVAALDAMVTSLTTPAAGGGSVGGQGGQTSPVGVPGTDDVASGGFPDGRGGTALLVDVRVGVHDGFDRVVLELEGGNVPSYRVGYVDPPVRADGSGDVVEVAGEATLVVRASPASGVDLSGSTVEETHDGPRRFAPDSTAVVREVVGIGDFEGQLAWAVGLERRVPFSVTVIEDPVRLVIDLVPGPGT